MASRPERPKAGPVQGSGVGWSGVPGVRVDGREVRAQQAPRLLALNTSNAPHSFPPSGIPSPSFLRTSGDITKPFPRSRQISLHQPRLQYEEMLESTIGQIDGCLKAGTEAPSQQGQSGTVPTLSSFLSEVW